MTYTSDITSHAALAAAHARQAKHETAACPKCERAVHPQMLAHMGQCGACRMAEMRDVVARAYPAS